MALSPLRTTRVSSVTMASALFTLLCLAWLFSLLGRVSFAAVSVGLSFLLVRVAKKGRLEDVNKKMAVSDPNAATNDQPAASEVGTSPDNLPPCGPLRRLHSLPSDILCVDSLTPSDSLATEHVFSTHYSGPLDAHLSTSTTFQCSASDSSFKPSPDKMLAHPEGGQGGTKSKWAVSGSLSPSDRLEGYSRFEDTELYASPKQSKKWLKKFKQSILGLRNTNVFPKSPSDGQGETRRGTHSRKSLFHKMHTAHARIHSRPSPMASSILPKTALSHSQSPVSASRLHKLTISPDIKVQVLSMTSGPQRQVASSPEDLFLGSIIVTVVLLFLPLGRSTSFLATLMLFSLITWGKHGTHREKYKESGIDTSVSPFPMSHSTRGSHPGSPTIAQILQHSHSNDPKKHAILEGFLMRE